MLNIFIIVSEWFKLKNQHLYQPYQNLLPLFQVQISQIQYRPRAWNLENKGRLCTGNFENTFAFSDFRIGSVVLQKHESFSLLSFLEVQRGITENSRDFCQDFRQAIITAQLWNIQLKVKPAKRWSAWFSQTSRVQKRKLTPNPLNGKCTAYVLVPKCPWSFSE